MEILYGYLYTLKQFLIENQTDKTTDIINSIDNIIKNTKDYYFVEQKYITEKDSVININPQLFEQHLKRFQIDH